MKLGAAKSNFRILQAILAVAGTSVASPARGASAPSRPILIPNENQGVAGLPRAAMDARRETTGVNPSIAEGRFTAMNEVAVAARRKSGCSVDPVDFSTKTTARERDGRIAGFTARGPLLVCLAFACVLLSGCMGLKAQGGGSAKLPAAGSGEAAELRQGENPQQATTAHVKEKITRTWETNLVGELLAGAIPEGGKVESKKQKAAGERNLKVAATTGPAQPISEVIERESVVSLGAAQKDTSRELAVRFQNMKPVQFVAIGLILAAGALWWFGWPTPAMIAGGTGIGLLVLGHAIVGHETLIIIVLIVAVCGIAVVRAYEKGMLDYLLPASLDKNKSGGSEQGNAAQITNVIGK